MALEHYDSLVDLQQRSCSVHANQRLFGTKVDGTFQWTTYAEFAELVDAFRGGLVQLGVEPEQKVAVISDNRVEWAVGAYACYGLGAHWVPMYENQNPRDWAHILRDSEAVAVICATQAIYDKIESIAADIPTLKHILGMDIPENDPASYHALLKTGKQHPHPAKKRKRSDIAGLLYTSGTTGMPKGVVLSHGNFVSNVHASRQRIPITPEDSSVSFLPWAHAFGQTAELHVFISAGASMAIAKGTATLIDDLATIRPSALITVPRVFNRFYDAVRKRVAEQGGIKQRLFEYAIKLGRNRRELKEAGQSSRWLDIQHIILDRLVFLTIRDRLGGHMRLAISGGAALPVEVGEFLEIIGIRVFEGYGLTETSPVISANSFGAQCLGTVGKPFDGVEVFICDDKLNILPAETEGEVVACGPNIMVGYHNQPEATAEVIVDLDGKRCFRTGDLGLLTADGFLKITGRFKEQYKLENGKYIVPTAVEDQLKFSGFINQAFIYGANRPYNVCLVVPDFEALTEWAQKHAIADLSPESLIEHPQINSKIGEELHHFGTELRGYERPKKWMLSTEDFTVDNELLTPKLSVKRKNVLAKYQEQLDALYDA